MTRTSIEWATDSWNPIAAYDRETGKRGWFCMKVSPGCTNCYAEQLNRLRGNGHLYRLGNLDKVRFELAPTLTDPLHWRKPRRVFVNSMTDLFLEAHTDEMISRVFAVMAGTHYFGLAHGDRTHSFLVLTKRPERMKALMSSPEFRETVTRDAEMLRLVHGTIRESVSMRKATREDRYEGYTIVREPRLDWPLPNVWLGVSVETQEQADLRIPLLLETPAAVRFISAEPLLGPVDLTGYDDGTWWDETDTPNDARLNWVIVGGESGPKARQFDMGWARDIVAQCHNANVACFVKQMGSKPVDPWADTGALINAREPVVPKFRDRKGGDPAEWPSELRVREYPREAALV